MRAGKAPPPNTLKDIDPILDALTPTKQNSEKRLGEITSVIVVAEAADEFPQHIVQKIIELPEDKRQMLMKIVSFWFARRSECGSLNIGSLNFCEFFLQISCSVLTQTKRAHHTHTRTRTRTCARTHTHMRPHAHTEF